MPDDSGYPTEKELNLIAEWNYKEPYEWFEYCKFLWHWGDDYFNHEELNMFNWFAHTGGWSGNESIIEAMQRNRFLWNLTWEESRRGGHFKFKIPETFRKNTR